jgi:hypothetical protein
VRWFPVLRRDAWLLLNLTFDPLYESQTAIRSEKRPEIHRRGTEGAEKKRDNLFEFRASFFAC